MLSSVDAEQESVGDHSRAVPCLRLLVELAPGLTQQPLPTVRRVCPPHRQEYYRRTSRRKRRTVSLGGTVVAGLFEQLCQGHCRTM